MPGLRSLIEAQQSKSERRGNGDESSRGLGCFRRAPIILVFKIHGKGFLAERASSRSLMEMSHLRFDHFRLSLVRLGMKPAQ